MPTLGQLQDRRTGERRRTPSMDAIVRAVAVAALLAFLAWAAKPLVPVTSVRFETDSIRRDRDKARSDSMLDRIDSRVGAIYCASLPPDKQPGCQ